LGTRYDHLTLDERKLIFQLREAKMSVPRIAERLDRHRSTIHREIRRNWHDDGPWLRGYFPEAAQTRTERRRIRRRKLHRDLDLARYVIARLHQAWSPEQIAGRPAGCDATPAKRVGSATKPSISSSIVTSAASRASASYSRADDAGGTSATPAGRVA
jgi:IS30 family transposase